MFTPMNIQILAALLFCIGLIIVMTRRNIFFLLMGIELMLNAVNVSFVGFSRQFIDEASIAGFMVPLFIIAIAAAEACIGLAMVICVVRGRNSLDVDAFSAMKE